MRWNPQPVTIIILCNKGPSVKEWRLHCLLYQQMLVNVISECHFSQSLPDLLIWHSLTQSIEAKRWRSETLALKHWPVKWCVEFYYAVCVCA